MTLSTYKKKRNFKDTPEPKGKLKASKDDLLFCVQKHAASRLHYDFRLEYKGAMLSWAVPKGPSMDPSQKRLAIQVEDHPFDYREFEGNIPKGNYGAGAVMLWDEGNFAVLDATSKADAEKKITAGLKKGHLTFILNGSKLKGEFALVKLQHAEKQNEWLLIKKGDDYATDKDILKKNKSVRTARTIEQIQKDA